MGGFNIRGKGLLQLGEGIIADVFEGFDKAKRKGQGKEVFMRLVLYYRGENICVGLSSLLLTLCIISRAPKA